MLPNGLLGVNYMAGFGLKNIINHQGYTGDIYEKYPRQQSYIIESDWEINTQNGGYKLISKEKKKNQGKIVKFVLKKFITTGSFMGLSFPVFAMKPQSILQTYAKCIAAAPLFFDAIQKDPTERIKKFIAFSFTFSRLFSDMDKPFNPTIGETFQAQIAGGLYSAEQTSHHPPQSSFHFQGKGYVLYGTLQLGADIGVNSATGYFNGDIHVKFEDGGKVFGRVLSGQMSGFVIGQNKFRPSGSCYAYDPINKIICSYKRDTKDFFKGQIGILRQKYQTRFEEQLKSNDRFTKFEAFKDKDYQCILSHMSACWTKYVSFNQKHYLDFQDPKWLPFVPTAENIKLLPSDSRHRKDIELRKQHKIKESQQEKEKVQQIQRYYRKLRKGQKNVKIEQLNKVDRLEQAELNNED